MIIIIDDGIGPSKQRKRATTKVLPGSQSKTRRSTKAAVPSPVKSEADDEEEDEEEEEEEVTKEDDDSWGCITFPDHPDTAAVSSSPSISGELNFKI